MSQNATTKAAVTVATIHENPANAIDALVYAASSSYKRQMNFSVPLKYDFGTIISIFEAMGFSCLNDKAKKEMRFAPMPTVWITKDIKKIQMNNAGKERSKYVSSPRKMPEIKVQATNKNQRVLGKLLKKLRAMNETVKQNQAGNNAIAILIG
jgi:hypothetical protein